MNLLTPEIRSQIQELTRRAGHIWRYLDGAAKQARIAELDAQMSEASFWNDQTAAQKVIGEANRLKNTVNPAAAFNAEIADMKAMLELVDEMDDDPDAEAYQQEVIDTLHRLQPKLDQLELASFLSGPNDGCNALLTVNSGAGGTESCDWADMLLRMYTRWAESADFSVEVLDIQPGEEAGISSATMRITGPNAFGYAKAERGVHRLVRISPFDSNARRHTSFSSVDVIAELEDDADIVIDPSEIRTDVYRASGKGGQHVNRTESAVRLTHIPSGIVVTCQNDRSQIKNKATAMRTLKSRLYEKQEDEKRNEMEKFYGEKGDIAWGNQIRSYVFQPYQMVKDLRTGVETGNVQAVMDGELDPFIHAWLRAGGPTSRKAAADRDFGDE
ncbi:MAG: peptide chain release factor 2 [Opitutales bacterium]|nr:peptide chain release factor 2 [Opitutales bacterium]MDP4644485.1 peptide chain release factor 2 [Opitutales bacterium]MDP4777261.1 peptide chain release factor 2 [Opitutales bacterium]MDP4883485.1 peptide chain release factor 2 [Opitutales bacterium]MDP5080031.1 peptide chain release factor 2 [Opitutales bacterium]